MKPHAYALSLLLIIFPLSTNYLFAQWNNSHNLIQDNTIEHLIRGDQYYFDLFFFIDTGKQDFLQYEPVYFNIGFKNISLVNQVIDRPYDRLLLLTEFEITRPDGTIVRATGKRPGVMMGLLEPDRKLKPGESISTIDLFEKYNEKIFTMPGKYRIIASTGGFVSKPVAINFEIPRNGLDNLIYQREGDNLYSYNKLSSLEMDMGAVHKLQQFLSKYPRKESVYLDWIVYNVVTLLNYYKLMYPNQRDTTYTLQILKLFDSIKSSELPKYAIQRLYDSLILGLANSGQKERSTRLKAEYLSRFPDSVYRD